MNHEQEEEGCSIIKKMSLSEGRMSADKKPCTKEAFPRLAAYHHFIYVNVIIINFNKKGFLVNYCVR